MLKLMLFLVIAAVVAAAAAWFAEHPGLVIIEWLNWRIETSVGLLLVGVLLLTAMAVAVFDMVRFVIAFPRRWREQRARRRLIAGYRALAHGLVAAAAGDPTGARQFARQVRRLLGNHDPALYLLEAQRAQLEGDEDDAIRQFHAMLKMPQTELLGLRGMLAYAIRAGDYDDALEFARRAYRRSPTTPWVLVTLFDLLTRAQQWQEALAILNQLADLKLVSAEVARRRRAILYCMLAEQAERAGSYAEARQHLRRAFRLAPHFAPAAVALARCERATGRPRLARKVLERAWRITCHPDLARAYLQLYAEGAPSEQLRAAQRLRALQPFEPLAYVVLAEVQMAAGALADARFALIRAEELAPSARVFRARAELERLAGSAAERLREWLTKAHEAAVDPAWVCEDTGEVFAEWKPFGATGRFDAVQWMVPPRVARLRAGEAPADFIVHRPAPGSTQLVPVPEPPQMPAKPEAAPQPADTGEARTPDTTPLQSSPHARSAAK